MIVSIAKNCGFSRALMGHLIRNPGVTQTDFACRLNGTPESTLRNWLEGRTSPKWDTLIALAPHLPDDVLWQLMSDLGGGRFVPAPSADRQRLDTQIVRDAILAAAEIADLARRADDCMADNFLSQSESDDLLTRKGRAMLVLYAFGAKVRAMAGRSIRRPA